RDLHLYTVSYVILHPGSRGQPYRGNDGIVRGKSCIDEFAVYGTIWRISFNVVVSQKFEVRCVEQLTPTHDRCATVDAEKGIEFPVIAQVNVVTFVQLHQVFLQEQCGEGVDDWPDGIISIVLTDVSTSFDRKL